MLFSFNCESILCIKSVHDGSLIYRKVVLLFSTVILGVNHLMRLKVINILSIIYH